MNLLVTLYVAVLFMALTPGVLLTLPKGGSKLVVAVVHGLVFALVYHFTNKLVLKMSLSSEGFYQNAAAREAAAEERRVARRVARDRAAELRRLRSLVTDEERGGRGEP